jgi:hypothetical protein
MQEHERAVRLEASADAAWALIRDIGNEKLVRGYVKRVEAHGAGAGAERTYHLEEALGGSIRERILRVDDAARELEYVIIDYGPVPMADYRGFISVAPAGPHACHVLIRARFVPVGVEPEECAALWRGNVDHFFANLRNGVARASA